MTTKDWAGVVVVWLMVVIVAFGVGFSIVLWAERQQIWVADMEDGTTTLEVKTNTGLQTDQFTPIQPADDWTQQDLIKEL